MMTRVISFLLFYVLLSSSYSALAVYEIAQTGQVESYANNDDGDLQLGRALPEQRFTDNLDGTITDELTGLMWLKDSYCANHHISGASSNSWNDAFAFVESLNNKTLITPCKNYSWAYDDWRVASINELQSLIPKGLKDRSSALTWLALPGDDSSGFSDTALATSPAWSSTTDASNPDKVWMINLDSGETLLEDKTSNTSMGYIFSAVRGISENTIIATGQTESHQINDDGENQNGYKPSEPRFVPLNDGTIVDRLSGLNWLQDANCTLSAGGTWQSAISSVSSVLLDPQFFANCATYTKEVKDKDWRIPNINELKSLLDYGKASPALSTGQPFNIATDKPFWTSTSSNGSANTNAWAVSFQSGKIIPELSKTDIAYAWPVRGPVEFPDLATNIQELQFDSEYLSDEPAEKSLEITNTGTSVLTINELSIRESNSTSASRHFSIGRDGCSNRSLDPAATCSTVIQFDPKASGTVFGMLNIDSNALGNETQTFHLSGTGMGEEKTESSTYCFIATAAYGSYLEPEVVTLRNFRDKYLLNSSIGSKLVDAYYHYSPPVARIIEANEDLRLILRLALSPIVYSIKYPTLFWLELLLVSFTILVRYRVKYGKSNASKTLCRILRTK